MEDLSENLPACLPPLLAELSMWHQTCSWLGWDLVQKLELCRRVRTAGGLVNRRSLTSPSARGRNKAIRSRSGSIFLKVCPGHSCWGLFLPDTKHRGRKEGSLSVPTDLPELYSPLARCQHSTDDHLLCPGLGENDTITTLAHKDSPEGITK